MIKQTIIDIFNCFSNKKDYNKQFVEIVQGYTISYFPDEDKIYINKADKNGRFRHYHITSEEKLKVVLADLFLKAFTTDELSFCEAISLLNLIFPTTRRKT